MVDLLPELFDLLDKANQGIDNAGELEEWKQRSSSVPDFGLSAAVKKDCAAAIPIFLGAHFCPKVKMMLEYYWTTACSAPTGRVARLLWDLYREKKIELSEEEQLIGFEAAFKWGCLENAVYMLETGFGLDYRQKRLLFPKDTSGLAVSELVRNFRRGGDPGRMDRR